MNKHLDCSFDDKFSALTDSGLVWLPWVGKNYQHSADNKLLVIGESHYTKKNDFVKIVQNKTYTRAIIYESSVCNDWKSRFFGNIPKALLGTDCFDREKLWEQIAFCNIVQRPMDYTIKERPVYDDFFGGWKTMINVLKIIKPSTCICVGLAASDAFNDSMKNLGIEHSVVAWGKPLDCTYLRTPVSIVIDGVSIEIYFIKHASSYFSWSKWHNYLKEHLPEQILNLKRVSLAKCSVDNIAYSQIIPTELNRTKEIPTWLMHKPILACNCLDAFKVNPDDAKFISLGRAQYDNGSASVKIWRKGKRKWSRQSEEVPIARLGYMMQMLLIGIKMTQSKDISLVEQSSLKEEIIVPDDLEFVRQQLWKDGENIVDSITEIRRLIDDIDLEEYKNSLFDNK